MTIPKVSVLVPAYDNEPFIDAAVQSVVSQTFSDFEIIASDDASHDATASRLDAWAARDPRVRVLRNERNLGMTPNWNHALRHARGELVIKLDGDDVFRPRALEVLVDAMRGNALGAGVRTLVCDSELDPYDGLPGDDAIMRGGIDPYRDHDLDTAQWYRIAAHGHQLWASGAVMWPRLWLTERNGFDERFGCGSDTELIWRTLEQQGVFAHRSYVGMLYRIRPGSVSDTYRTRGWLSAEGAAANLLTLHRYRQHFRLPRSLRLRYAAEWERWRAMAADNEQKLPPEIWEKLVSVISQLTPPSKLDMLMLRAREAIPR